ncbi:MAG: hypothetical protein KKI02_00140 [Planctomycetes bacterium]|nr:hypothetical protein [Planctomycetota bacterium]
MKRLIMQSFLVAALPLAALAQTEAVDKPTLDDLLKVVPDDPALVVMIPDFSEIVSGLQAFGAGAGIQDLVELDADTLFDELEVSDLPVEWQECLDKSGPFVFALTDPESEPLLICTVTEAPETPLGELVELKGRILIVAPDAEVMQAVKSAGGAFTKRFAERVRTTLEKHDVGVYFNVASWSVQIQQMLSVGEMIAQMGVAATSQPAQVNLTMVKWLFELLRTTSDEGQAVVLAGRVDGDGVHVSEVVYFDPSGKIADYLGKIGKPEKDLLRGLPPPAGMIVMATEWRTPGSVETMTEKMLDVLLAATTQPADQAERPKLTPEVRKLYRILDGYNGVMSFGAESAGMSANGIYLTDQPQAFFDGFQEMWKLAAPMMANMAPGFTMDLSEGLETVGSVKARVYRFKFNVADEEAQRAIQAIYGESTTVYAAPHAEGVAYAMGPAEAARANLEKLLAGNGGSLSTDPRVVSALRRLSPKPQAFVLLDLPGLMIWTAEFAGIAGGGMPQFKPPEAPLPYLGFGLYLHETAISAELFFPAKTLKYIVEQSGAPTSAPAGAEPY